MVVLAGVIRLPASRAVVNGGGGNVGNCGHFRIMGTQKPVEWVSALITRFEEQVLC